MSFLPILVTQGRHASRHAAAVAARRGDIRPGHVTVVQHVASCALFACTCLVTGPLRATEAEAQTDADQHTTRSHA